MGYRYYFYGKWIIGSKQQAKVDIQADLTSQILKSEEYVSVQIQANEISGIDLSKCLIDNDLAVACNLVSSDRSLYFDLDSCIVQFGEDDNDIRVHIPSDLLRPEYVCLSPASAEGIAVVERALANADTRHKERFQAAIAQAKSDYSNALTTR